MKKVIGVICFIAAAGVGYAIGLVRGVVETMREHDTNPEHFARMSNEVNEELNNLHDSFNDLKEDMFKK
jgi:hypothetical protein